MEVLYMTAASVEPHKSSLGSMDANLMAVIAYVGGAILSLIPYLGFVAWLVPLVIFFMEKNSIFVKFHAMQSFLLNVVGAILAILIAIISGIALAAAGTVDGAFAALGTIAVIGVLGTIITLIILVFAIIAIVNAYGYKLYKIPVVGNFAEKFANKTPVV